MYDQGLRDSLLPSAHHGPTPSYATDLVVCVALGCDMFDCVFPTRTAVRLGQWVAGVGLLMGQGWGGARKGEDLVVDLPSPPLSSLSALALPWCLRGTCS